MTIEASEATPGDPLGRSAGERRPARARRARAALVTVLVLAMAAVAFLVRSGGSDPDLGPAARTQAGLCATLDAAAHDDVAGARRTFYDRSHEGLHELAARAAAVDRAAAARLLETKEPVEALLGGTPEPAELVAALDRLTGATARAAGAVGETDVKGCG